MNKSNIHLTKTIFGALFLVVLMSSNVYSQFTRVQFLKVKASENDYLALESQWKSFHQERLEKEQIYARYILKKHFQGTQDEYNFAIVTVYPTIGSIGDGKSLNRDLVAKIEEARDIVKTELYDTPIILEVTNLPQFINMEFMKVEEGNDNVYLTIEDEIWKPAHAEMKKTGVLTTWSIYRQLYPGGYGGEYNFVVANGFADQKKVTFEASEGWDDLLLKVHPDLDLQDTYSRTFASRQLVKIELWEILDSVVPQN